MALLEEILTKIEASSESPEDKRLALRYLAEEGILQNSPSEQYNDQEVSGIFRVLGEQGIIPTLTIDAQGNVPLPQPAPVAAQPTPESPGAVAATPAPGVGGTLPTTEQAGGSSAAPPAAPPAQVPLPAAPGPSEPTPTESLLTKLKALGAGAADVAGGLTGASDVVQMAQDPAIRNKLGSDFVAPNVGEIGGTIAGGFMGAPLGPVGMAAGALAGGAIGSGAGLVVGRKATGQPVTVGEAALESFVSFLPEMLESSAKGVMNFLAKNSPDAQKIVENFMANFATGNATKVFDPPSREQVDQLFELVHQSNTKVKGDNLKNAMESLTKERWAGLKDTLQNIGTQRYGAEFGSGMAEALDKVRAGEAGIEMSIGKIQDLRSQMLKRIRNHENPTADDLAIERLVGAFDREIDNALKTGDADARLLKEARNGWARLKAAETLKAMVMKPPVSRIDRAGERITFNMSNLGQILREPANGIQAKVRQDLEAVPGAKDAFESWLGKLKERRGVIEVSTTGLSMNQLMGVPAMLGNIIVNVRGREALEKMLTMTKGPLDINKLAIALNASRRGAEVATGSKAPSQIMAGEALQSIPNLGF